MSNYAIVEEDMKVIASSNVDFFKLYGKTVVISGANGFLPAYLVETLLYLNQSSNEKASIRIIGLVRNIEKAKRKFAHHLQNKWLTLIEQDVCESINIDQDVHFIIHAASQASPKYYGIDPVGTLNANLVGTINMLELARLKTVESFLYFSSGEVYGHVPSEFNPVKEDFYGYLDPTQVRACYGESKRMGENICVSYRHQFGVPAKIVRPFHTYGPGMLLDDGRVYADFINDIVLGNDIQMKSDGSAIRAFCYLTDATIGFFTVLLHAENAQAYNVGNPFEEHSIRELAGIVSQVPNPVTRVINLPTNNDNLYLKSPVSKNTPNIEKLMKLGWKPTVTVAEGFERTYLSYK